MRTENSIKNIVTNFLYNFLNYGLRFVSRIIFVKTLAEVYLGVNGLLSNVLGILSLTELGIGTAIGYSLYEPLAKQDNEKVRSLMNLYKKAYRIISAAVLFLGLAILPFLPYLIKDNTGIENLNIIYLIFLLNMVIGYLFSYKRTLIISDQKKYKIMPLIMFFSIATTLLQIIVLLIFRNYIIYLLVQSICIVLENIFVNKYIDKQYSYLKSKKEIKEISKTELKTIKGKIGALLLHKIGSYTLSSTDNLIISALVGIVSVGIYSNYSLIVGMVSSLIYVLTSNVISSIGNLIASEDEKKSLYVFDEMNLICYILYGVSSVCMINLFNPFIELFFGTKFLLTMPIVCVIVANHYLTGMNNVVISVQSAAGLYENDKYIPLIQSVVNLVVSIYLGMNFGLIGIFIGTVVSTMLPLIIKPIIVYKNVFKIKADIYFKDFFIQSTIIIVTTLLSYFSIQAFNISNLYLRLVIGLFLSVIIPSLFIHFYYRNTDAYKNLRKRIVLIFNKFKQKKVEDNHE